MTGVKAHAVDPVWQHHHPFKTILPQAGGNIGSGYQRYGGAVMKTPQPAQHPLLYPAKAVITAVTVEIGVEGAEHRYIQPLGLPQRGIAQRAFGGDIHQIRALALPGVTDTPASRQAGVHIGVKGKGQTRAMNFFKLWLPGLAWPGADNLHRKASGR